MNLYIDVETIPAQSQAIKDGITERLQPPGNMKNKETIERWYKENGAQAAHDQWLKTALDGTYGELFSIAWAVNDGDVQVMSRGSWWQNAESEASFISSFFSRLYDSLMSQSNVVVTNDVTWIGHNVLFDVRMIYQRCVINQVRPTITVPYDAAPWDKRIYDTMTKWAGVRDYVKQERLVEAFGIVTDDDAIDGSQVWEMVQSGDIATVEKHNMLDVEKVREIHKRMTFEV